jgi:molybdopterin converting factor small subunit
MITVHVKLFALLRDRFPDLGIGEAMPVELPSGATIGSLIEQLDLPRDQIKVIFVNNVTRQVDHPLSAGDRVGIFPPVGGG